jgi:hypothetical protein
VTRVDSIAQVPSLIVHSSSMKSLRTSWWAHLIVAPLLVALAASCEDEPPSPTDPSGGTREVLGVAVPASCAVYHDDSSVGHHGTPVRISGSAAPRMATSWRAGSRARRSLASSNRSASAAGDQDRSMSGSSRSTTARAPRDRPPRRPERSFPSRKSASRHPARPVGATSSPHRDAVAPDQDDGLSTAKALQLLWRSLEMGEWAHCGDEVAATRWVSCIRGG